MNQGWPNPKLQSRQLLRPGWAAKGTALLAAKGGGFATSLRSGEHTQ
jgi:hypothetical protein